MGSTALAQIIPLTIAPVIARFYSPADFGLYAVFIALAAILTPVASLALNNAVIAEATPEDQAHVMQLAISAAFVVCILILVIVIALPMEWIAYLIGKEAVIYLYWLPLTVFSTTSYQALYAWAVRAQRFSFIARNKLVTVLATVGVQIVIGFIAPSPMGFILANLLGIGLSAIMLLWLFLRETKGRRLPFDLSSATARLRRHSSFPIWSVPANLVNGLSATIPDFFINRVYGADSLGQYAMANRLLNLPISFVASSIQDILRQQAAEEVAQQGQCKKSFLQFFLVLVFVAFFVIAPAILTLPYVLPLVLGHQWDHAGLLVRATGFLTVMRFISSPLSYIWFIRGQQRLDFFWQLGLLVLTFSSLIFPVVLGLEIGIVSNLAIYGMVVGFWYVFCLMLSYHIARRQQ